MRIHTWLTTSSLSKPLPAPNVSTVHTWAYAIWHISDSPIGVTLSAFNPRPASACLSCEPILTNPHPHPPNPANPASRTRCRVSESSHNEPPTSSIGQSRPLNRPLCERILTQRHPAPPAKEPATSPHRPASAAAANSRVTFAAVAARLSAVSRHASARDCGSRMIGNTASMPHA